MSTLTVSPTIAFSEVELERITGVDHLTLRKIQPNGFGVPGHWRLNGQFGSVYTQKGAEAMVDALKAHGYEAGSASLRAKLKELIETPALGHFARAQRKAAPWFKQGGMA